MKLLSGLKGKMPSLKSAAFSLLGSILLIMAFPGFELWVLSWVALIPLFAAIEREKESFMRSALVGWLFGTLFFFATCWWLTFAPITYAGIPVILAYLLLFVATAVAGFYFAIFGGVFSLFLRRFGHWGVLTAPFLLTTTEFLRLWTTGNNWNSIGYSQAFSPVVGYASFGGVFFVGFFVIGVNAFLLGYVNFLKVKIGSGITRIYPHNLLRTIRKLNWKGKSADKLEGSFLIVYIIVPIILFVAAGSIIILIPNSRQIIDEPFSARSVTHVIAVQPNIPMKGLTQTEWRSLRQRHVDLAEKTIRDPDLSGPAQRQAENDTGPDDIEKRKRFYEELATESFKKGNKIVIFPESPMNFQYERDPEFRGFIKDFAVRNNVSVLFNSAEPDKRRKFGFFNSAVMVNEKGEKISQYDKIYLLPFGEFVPLPETLAQFVPTMVGRFSKGEEYDLLPFGDAKAGVMICFESHFASLSREYVKRGADVLVEMTNDGYLGDTPVLRQHLASAVFRAVETNRPVLRVTNIGITGYINQRGEILDSADAYSEASRVWTVAKAEGGQTFYVKYGDWFAWLCSVVSLGLLFLYLKKGKFERIAD